MVMDLLLNEERYLYDSESGQRSCDPESVVTSGVNLATSLSIFQHVCLWRENKHLNPTDLFLVSVPDGGC